MRGTLRQRISSGHWVSHLTKRPGSHAPFMVQGSKQKFAGSRFQVTIRLPGTQYCSVTHSKCLRSTVLQQVTGTFSVRHTFLKRVSTSVRVSLHTTSLRTSSQTFRQTTYWHSLMTVSQTGTQRVSQTSLISCSRTHLGTCPLITRVFTSHTGRWRT